MACFVTKSNRKEQKVNNSLQYPRASPIIVLAEEPHHRHNSQVEVQNERNTLPHPQRPDFEVNNPYFQSKPKEIVSYNSDLPKTLIPYAPPPPVNGLSFADGPSKTSASGNPYNIPMEDIADYDEVDTIEGNPEEHIRKISRTHSLVYPSSHNQSSSDGYYDTVEAVLEESPNLSSSLRLSPYYRKNQSDLYDSHYQSPRRRALPVSRNTQSASFLRYHPADINIYTEQLEPSMLNYHSSVSSFGSEAPLPYCPIYDSPLNYQRADQPLEISYHNIKEMNDLGNGRFGRIVLAYTVDLSLKDLKLGDNTDRSRSFLVAVKKLKNSELKSAFQKEIKFMSGLKHANVIRLLGVCSMEVDPFIIVEYMENGDLHEFLRKQELVADDTKSLQEGQTTPLILLYMGLQIASGMRYLASRNFIHRDLATRNCLVGQEFVVKISDFGMSRNLYESYYYRVKGQLILPIRWMPQESFYGKFSTKSDVWSFGVTLWEIYCMGESEPYSEMSNDELIEDATKGANRTLLRCPDICSQDLYDVMLRCWVHNPLIRADFEEVYSRLFVLYMTKSQEANK